MFFFDNFRFWKDKYLLVRISIVFSYKLMFRFRLLKFLFIKLEGKMLEVRMFGLSGYFLLEL